MVETAPCAFCVAGAVFVLCLLCAVCFSGGGNALSASGATVLAEKVLPSELRLGDEFVIVNDAGGNTVSVNAAGSRLAPASVTVGTRGGKQVLTSISDEAAVFRLEQGDGNDVLLRTRQGYLTSAETGNGL